MKNKSKVSLTAIAITSVLSIGNIAQAADIPAQIYNRTTVFSQLDTDKDGFLVSSEYGGTDQLFNNLDTNRDGKLSVDETRYMVTFSDIPTGSFMMGADVPVTMGNARGGGRGFRAGEGRGDSAGREGMAARRGGGSPAVISKNRVVMDGYKMSTTEVTTAQYAQYLNAALEVGQIVVERGLGGTPGRIIYPIPVWQIKGAKGTPYEDKLFTALSPVAGLSHIRADGHPLLIPEHPLNQSWISYSPELKSFTADPGFEDWPAAFIKWHGAMAYAEFYGLSLPTEAEWEYAASGGQQFEFATSDGSIGCELANYKCYNGMRQEGFEGVDTPEDYLGYRVKVGSYPANPFGIFDLAGSVWEWCLDWYAEDIYQQNFDNGIVRNPVNLDGIDPPADDPSVIGGPGGGWTHDARVTRGGSYQYNEATTKTAFRNRLYPFRGNDHWGFRVVYRSPSMIFNGRK